MRIIEKYVSALIKLMRYYTEIDFDFQYIDTQGFLNDLETTFSIIARNKETQFRLIREELPNKIYTDELHSVG